MDKLLYGKNSIEKIVSVEPSDGSVEIFTESNGEIQSQVLSNKYWILSNKKEGPSWVRLKGDLHYKWGKQFSSREDYLKARSILRRGDVFSIYDPKESFMVKDGVTYFKGLSPSEVSILSFDLETTTLNSEDENAKILLISLTYRSFSGDLTKCLFAYDDYSNQAEMLTAFCKKVRELNPSIIIGHNILGFDFQYLKGVADKEGIGLTLGRNDSDATFDSYESQFRKESNQFIKYHKVHIYGREVVDTLFLSIKHDIASRKYSSYGLKNIIKQEGLEKQDRTFYDASKIRFNYTDKVEWEKIKEYCRDDADDALALYDLMIRPFFYMTQSIPKSFQSVIESASGSQLNSMMVRSYLQEAHSIPKAHTQEVFEGAISIGNPGIYSNVFKIDISSLYPSIILQYEVYDSEKDPNANFLALVSKFTETRLKYKRLFKETNDPKYDALQGAFKILINSAYGFMGAPGLAFNSPKCAAFVTEKGRDILKTSIKWATGKDYEAT